MSAPRVMPGIKEEETSMSHALQRVVFGLLLCLALAAIPAGTVTQALATASTQATAAERSPTHAFAPPNRPGPKLSVPAADLAESLHCTPDVARSRKQVALFVPATALDPDEFSWNWFRALDRIHHPYCSVTLPGHGLGDIQVSAEYVVHAVRHVSRLTGRKIAVVGHSQGGLEARFALRFWPDTRELVSDYVSLGTPNHGSPGNTVNCAGGSCPPAFWQMRPEADFVRALNSYQETFAGIAYTNVYTTLDQYVTPNQDDTGTSSLHGGGGRITNVSIQSVCPADPGEHIAIGTSDPVAYALTLDALTHPGPARTTRLDRSVCGRQYMPGVDPAAVEENLAKINDAMTSNWGAAPIATAEPALKPYVYARP
jgi:pimeloyl-ACP methyl ester carboxylesterase